MRACHGTFFDLLLYDEKLILPPLFTRGQSICSLYCDDLLIRSSVAVVTWRLRPEFVAVEYNAVDFALSDLISEEPYR